MRDTSIKNLVQLCFAGALFLHIIIPNSALAEFTAHDCVIAEVQLVVVSPIGARVAVRCAAPAPGGISWFAYEIQADPERAKMVLSILSTAKVAGRTVRIAYESTASGATWGCGAGNCRPIMQVRMF